jgi:hypothetical protein
MFDKYHYTTMGVMKVSGATEAPEEYPPQSPRGKGRSRGVIIVSFHQLKDNNVSSVG